MPSHVSRGRVTNNISFTQHHLRTWNFQASPICHEQITSTFYAQGLSWIILEQSNGMQEHSGLFVTCSKPGQCLLSGWACWFSCLWYWPETANQPATVQVLSEYFLATAHVLITCNEQPSCFQTVQELVPQKCDSFTAQGQSKSAHGLKFSSLSKVSICGGSPWVHQFPGSCFFPRRLYLFYFSSHETWCQLPWLDIWHMLTRC